MYETNYDILHQYFGEKCLHLHYMDTDSFISSVISKDIIKDLRKLEDIFDFSSLDKNQEKLCNKKEKVVGNFKFETPKSICIDEPVCLRSKMYPFKCGDDIQKKLKGISKSQSKNIKFEDKNNCLDGEEYQKDCDKHINRSINHEMYLQKLKKSSLSLFDNKRCYKNETGSKPWNSSDFLFYKLL